MNDRFNRFKFRTWNKKTQKMKKVMALISEEGVYYSLMVNENEAVVMPCEQPHMVLMQCTGLKDKNGVLIYEGDIITRCNDKYSCNYEVIHDDDIFAYGLKTQGDKSGALAMLKRVIDEYEVIGNIYENPELLEVKNVN